MIYEDGIVVGLWRWYRPVYGIAVWAWRMTLVLLGLYMPHIVHTLESLVLARIYS